MVDYVVFAVNLLTFAVLLEGLVKGRRNAVMAGGSFWWTLFFFVLDALSVLVLFWLGRRIVLFLG